MDRIHTVESDSPSGSNSSTPTTGSIARQGFELWVSNFERATAFEGRFARAQGPDIVDLAWGVALLQAEFPLSRYHNRISVTSAVGAAEVLAAHADLYVDRVDDIAQFENLVTHRSSRGRGYGNALIRDALWRAGRAGCELHIVAQ